MKKFYFGTLFLLIFSAFACTRSSVLLEVEESGISQVTATNRSMVSVTGSDIFTARSSNVEAETWNGKTDETADCAPPPQRIAL